MPTISEALEIALAHHREGRLDLAEEIYIRILAAEPNFPDALHLRGAIAYQRGNLQQAVEWVERAIRADGNQAVFHNTLGQAQQALGDFAQAEGCYRRALTLDPGLAEAHYNLGNLLRATGNPADAVPCYQEALRLKPNYWKAYINLGLARKELEQFDEAIACYQTALRLNPQSALAWLNLGNVLYCQGRIAEAIEHYQRALSLDPQHAEARGNLLSTMQYLPGMTLPRLAEAGAEFERRHAAPLRTTWPTHENSRDPDRPLRVGFVSPDLGRHPVGRLFVGLFEQLPDCGLETICYSDRSAEDDVTARFRQAAHAWRRVLGVSDQALADQIRGDRIDILFDLAGHTARNRLLTFARKPAPVQITWIGSEGTTGLLAMDYLLADRHLVPPESEAYYRERVLRMPQGYLCYDPPREAGAVGPLPALAAGQVTFASFNNPAKITPEVMRVWAEILRRTPHARLVLKYSGLDAGVTRERVVALAAECDIDPARLQLRGWSAYAEMLAAYQEVDLALDPFPFSGCATTCDALWMGVPVITCPGETFASRHSLSHLSTVGLSELVAKDLDDYIALAVRLAGDLPRLAALRGGLREQVARSPLCDAQRFAQDFGRILRDVWRRWVAEG
jgi:predicted O-linked N-acetylglucosamine transferase (SPINDLY family)